MNVSKSPLRRTTALVAGSLIGLAGVAVFASPAQAHHSSVTGVATCDDVTGKYVVDWTVDVIGSEKYQNFKFVKVNAAPAALQVGTKVVKDTLLPNGKYTAKQIVDGTAKFATLTVNAQWAPRVGDDRDRLGKVKLAGNCKIKETPAPNPSVSTPVQQPSTPVQQPSASTPVQQPSASTPVDQPSASTPVQQPSTPVQTPATPPVEIPADLPAEPIFNLYCDAVEVGVDNTKNKTPFKLDFKTSKGETRTLTIPAGKKDTAVFSATEGFSVDVTFTVEYKGKTYTESGTLPFEKPEGCDEGGEGGGLPVTGAAAGGIAAGAAGLLAAGAAMFFIARRRKVKFTA